MDTFLQDMRYALRALRKHSGFTAVAVITLALGIGANTAIFSVVDAVLLRPLPYRDVDHLVTIATHESAQPNDRNPTSLPDALDWREQNHTLAGLAAFAFNRYELNGPEGTDLARAAIATADLFAVLGTAPEVGRTPGPVDDHEAVVVLSHRVWMQRYHGDRAVIGRTVNLYDTPYTIIGVMPAGFHFPTPDIDLWTSLYPLYSAPVSSGMDWLHGRGLRGYRVVARLKPGVTIAAAEAELNAVEGRLGAEYRDDAGIGVSVTPVSADAAGGSQRALWLLLGAAGLVLLIACANVAHLLLARTTTRAREMAVRQALGAQRARLARQMITESVVLGGIGGVAGVIVAIWGTAALVRLAPSDIPRLEMVAVNGWVLAFAGVISLVAGVLFGLAPAWQAWRSDAMQALGSSARGVGASAHGGTARRTLMAAEVALALVLLMGTGLLLRSFSLLLGADPGFRTDHLLTFHVILPSPDAGKQAESADRVVARLAALPGVVSAGAATSLPPSMVQEFDAFTIDGRPAPAPGSRPSALLVPATPGYLTTLAPTFLAGRNFTDADRATTAPVMIINASLAREYFPHQDPLGQRIAVSGGPSREVVGVVGDVTYLGLGTPPGPTIYLPFAQRPFGGVWVALRTSGEPMAMVETVRAALREISPGMNPRNPASMETVLSASVVAPRFRTSLIALFGAVALVLAAVGIYGVIGYGVAQRTGEIGVRLALGASRPSVLALIVRQGMAPVAIGLGAGLVGALALTRLLGRLLYQVTPTDPVTFAAVTIVLILVSLLAAYIPARRAARVDPMAALRHD